MQLFADVRSVVRGIAVTSVVTYCQCGYQRSTSVAIPEVRVCYVLTVLGLYEYMNLLCQGVMVEPSPKNLPAARSRLQAERLALARL